MFLIPFDKSPIKAEVDDQFARRNARSHLRDEGKYEIQTEFWGSTVSKALSSSIRGSNEAKTWMKAPINQEICILSQVQNKENQFDLEKKEKKEALKR